MDLKLTRRVSYRCLVYNAVFNMQISWAASWGKTLVTVQDKVEKEELKQIKTP